MRLKELQAALGGELRGAGNPTLASVYLDSRQVSPGGLFAAMPGTQSNGVRFAADAVHRGAAAVLMPHEHAGCAASSSEVRASEGAAPLGVPLWVHPEARRTAGLAAALLQGDPSRSLEVCAITGTNGKTTTAHLLGQLLDRGGLVPAVLGTAGHRLAGQGVEPSTHTTPDAPALQALLARHLQAGGRSVAAEVSSHALMQERHAGLAVDVAVFTNLTREHLDYHGSMAAYAQAKARLFQGLAPGAHAVVHKDDPAAGVMIAAAREAGASVLTYSARQDADLRASSLVTGPEGTRFDIEGMGICSCDLLLPLQGRFNVENAMAAALAARLMGVRPSDILDGLASTFSAPGRLEPVPNDRGIAVYVDYAHSPDALERVLAELRSSLEGSRATRSSRSSRGRLWCVFGCGGDRDQGKRAAMGASAARLADEAIVTNDNPRGEAPQAIADAILAGARAAGGAARLRCELDRRSAIAMALEGAQPGDVVLLAGKGHETGQRMGEQELPFDDRLVAQEMLP